MSVFVKSIMDDAAITIGDPDYRRVTVNEMHKFYNRTARIVARRLKTIEYEAFFDLQANDLYKLPDDCIQVRKLFVTESPSDSESYYSLDEIFEDEFSGLTNRARPSGSPRCYYVRQGYFHVYPKPSAVVLNGGKMIYWGMPPTSYNYTTDVIPFSDLVQDTLTEGVVVYALKRMSRLDEAAAREREWYESMNIDRNVMEDRSGDKRPSLRARSRYRDYYDGQV